MTYLENKTKEYSNYIWYCVFGIIVSLVLVQFSLIFIGLIILLMIIIEILHHQKTLWKLGSEGESIVSNILMSLEGTHHIINDVNLPSTYGNIDHIVVGKNGVFAIETKHHNGYIECVGDDWRRLKVGRRGTTYSAPIGNPSKQIKTNSMILRNLIKEKCGVDNLWVEAIVTFSNEEATVTPINPTVNILEPEMIPEWINSYKSKNCLNDIQIKQIINTLS